MSDTVIDVLVSDHRAVLELLGTPPDALTPARCEQAVTAVVRHFVAEEQYLLPLVRDHLPGGVGRAHAEYEEHLRVETELRTLEELEHDPDGVAALLGVTGAALREHVGRQEQQLFPDLLRACPTQELAATADGVLGAEQLAPTRPRRVHRESARANKLVSLVEGYVDHARDHYAHRAVSR